MAGAGMSASHPIHRVGEQDVTAALTGRLRQGVEGWAGLAAALAEPALHQRVAAAGADLVRAVSSGGTLLVCGNGGSAAIASHVAAEFIGKCIHDRDPLPAVNLAESLSSVTAVGNDYGYEHVFSRGVRALGRPGDVLLAMSTSGRSRNVLEALPVARERGVTTIVMTGSAGVPGDATADHVLMVPSDETPRIQEVHMLWAHAWCEAVDLLSRDAD